MMKCLENRSLCQAPADSFRAGHELGGHRQRRAGARAGKRRMEDVEAQPLPGVLQPQAFGERLDSPLGGGIGREIGKARHTYAGAGEEYAAAGAHVRRGCAGEVDCAKIVYIKCSLQHVTLSVSSKGEKGQRQAFCTAASRPPKAPAAARTACATELSLRTSPS